jgi:hypothetical protein
MDGKILAAGETKENGSSKFPLAKADSSLPKNFDKFFPVLLLFDFNMPKYKKKRR